MEWKDAFAVAQTRCLESVLVRPSKTFLYLRLGHVSENHTHGLALRRGSASRNLCAVECIAGGITRSCSLMFSYATSKLCFTCVVNISKHGSEEGFSQRSFAWDMCQSERAFAGEGAM